MAEVFFVFGVRLVANARLGAVPPVAFDGHFAVPNAHELPWWNLTNFPVRSQVCLRVMSEVSGDIVLVDMESVPRKQHQGSEIRGPPKLTAPEVVKDVPDGHIVDGQHELAQLRLPNGNGPVANHAVEAMALPAIERGSENCDIGGTGF